MLSYKSYSMRVLDFVFTFSVSPFYIINLRVLVKSLISVDILGHRKGVRCPGFKPSSLANLTMLVLNYYA